MALFCVGEEGGLVEDTAVVMEEWGRLGVGAGRNALFWTVRSKSNGDEYEVMWPNEEQESMELISFIRDYIYMHNQCI